MKYAKAAIEKYMSMIRYCHLKTGVIIVCMEKN